MVAINITPLGDQAVLIQLGEQIDEQTNTRVRALTSYLTQHPFEGMVEYIPAFTSVTVFYDPMRVHLAYNDAGLEEPFKYPYEIVETILAELVAQVDENAAGNPKLVEIPVCYDEEFGVDLAHVAEHNQLSIDEVIQIHSGREYLVYMLGFAPGFPYLGGMDKRIATPRRATPRLKIPALTVGIAGEQTGVYPIETPGGWQLIGRTPSALFLPEQHPPTLLQAGDRIRFYPISRKDYDRWER